MIPEYRLINSLVNLPINKVTKKVIKNKIKTFDYDKQTKIYNFMFNVNNNRVFNHVIGLDSELNQFSLDTYFPNIIDFNFILAGLMPVFEFQTIYYKDYKKIQDILFNESLLNPDIQKWYQESLNLKQPNTEDLTFILSNKKLPKAIKTKIISLTHISGQLFETLNTNNYQLGYYLMLFYLLNLETKKTMQFNSSTNWNLKSFFLYEDLFSYKLLVMQKFNQALMELKGKNFNLYWRVINYITTGHYE
ncbi:hypothetical protein [Spiroplasma platyhelix]|uniref:Uncharacterized protein n=1 Tax=Spiroplasma platyhelix PALS-1 TaxID=1276218 RepID=A0A846TRW6_9MOLU|nr:hypothetical protein [Spiroplasma platyhelix]MBE4703872.1 hypothetical protein [Spiroplasma platyhelix PALS-1]NKE38245.1 hypothetical protein [Spiroplasma platyhelix PALS-1]UJB29130.1 hypothetical protein SPLAT_v1c03660 [Spiroplasma platyhelix PALS-1]